MLVDQVMLDGVRIWLLVIAFGSKIGLESSDLQAGFTGVRSQLDVIEQHAKSSVLNGDEDGLAGVGPADTEALSGDGDASVLVDASHRTQWGLPVGNPRTRTTAKHDRVRTRTRQQRIRGRPEGAWATAAPNLPQAER